MPGRNTLIGVGIALAILILGLLGALSNSKPAPVPASAADVTKAAAEKAGAQVLPTPKQ